MEDNLLVVSEAIVIEQTSYKAKQRTSFKPFWSKSDYILLHILCCPALRLGCNFYKKSYHRKLDNKQRQQKNNHPASLRGNLSTPSTISNKRIPAQENNNP